MCVFGRIRGREQFRLVHEYLVCPVPFIKETVFSPVCIFGTFVEIFVDTSISGICSVSVVYKSAFMAVSSLL